MSVLGYPWEWWLTEALPGFGAVTSLILVVYYAKLARQNTEQTKAVKAGYTPSLDVWIDFEGNELVLSIVNRGEGTAKFIKFEMEIEFRDEEKRAYVINFDTTLSTNHALRWNSSKPEVRIEPIIYDLEDGTQPRLLSQFLSDYDGMSCKTNILHTDVMGENEYKRVLSQISTKITGETLEEVLGNRTRGSPVLVGNEDFGLFGPHQNPLHKRLRKNLKKYGKITLENISRFFLGYSIVGNLHQTGLGYMEWIEAEAIPYHARIEEKHNRFIPQSEGDDESKEAR